MDAQLRADAESLLRNLLEAEWNATGTSEEYYHKHADVMRRVLAWIDAVEDLNEL